MGPRWNRAKFRLGVLASLLAAGSVQAQVQAPMDPAMERQVEDAYRQVLRQPGDLAAWSRYARLQVDGGNYEGGIAALERLMLQPDYPPGLPLEIGTLYFRLGSYAMAEAMVRQALDDPRLPADQRAFGQALLRDVQKRNQRSQLSGHASFGLRTQTNPAYRSSESTVLSGGLAVPLPASQQPDSDWDASLGLSLRHLYDLETQNSAAINTTFGVHVVDYHDSRGGLTATPTNAYDLLLLDFTTGIDFKPLPASLPQLTLRPHVAFSHLSAQGHRYLDSKGVGLDFVLRMDERTLAEVTLDVHSRDFNRRVDLANADEVSGRLAGVRGRLVREFAPGHVLAGDIAFRSNRTYRQFNDYDQQEARVTYSYSYASPVASLQGGWTTSAWLAGVRRDYDAADPSISAATSRRDTEWRIGLGQVVPLADRWFAQFTLEHARNRSNLPNFRYRNTSASATVLRSF